MTRLKFCSLVLLFVVGTVPVFAQEPTGIPIATASINTSTPSPTMAPATVATGTPTPAAPTPGVSGGTPTQPFVPIPSVSNWQLPNVQAPATFTPYLTRTPNATQQAFLGGANNLLSTAVSLSESGGTGEFTYNGEGVNTAETMASWEQWIVLFFSYLKGLDPDVFGNMAPLILIVIMLLFVFIIVRGTIFAIEILTYILGIMKRIVEWASQFIG